MALLSLRRFNVVTSPSAVFGVERVPVPPAVAPFSVIVLTVEPDPVWKMPPAKVLFPLRIRLPPPLLLNVIPPAPETVLEIVTVPLPVALIVAVPARFMPPVSEKSAGR